MIVIPNNKQYVICIFSYILCFYIWQPFSNVYLKLSSPWLLQISKFIHLKSLMSFCFSSNMCKLQIINLFFYKLYDRCLMSWWLHMTDIVKTWSTFILSPHHIMINLLYVILSWMMFHVLSYMNKRKVSWDKIQV
jgi:hypothetical protein